MDDFFESTVEVPRIKIGKGQTIASMVNEEVLLFSKYPRGEIVTLIPRIVRGGYSGKKVNWGI